MLYTHRTCNGSGVLRLPSVYFFYGLVLRLPSVYFFYGLVLTGAVASYFDLQ